MQRSSLGSQDVLGPTVVAVRCGQGHLSPVHAGVCRVCGAPLATQQPIEAHRPPLGILRLPQGGTITLDRGAILGRNPHVPAGYVGEQPNLVKIPDPNRDLSSQHVEIRLDAWLVTVKDLESTNGTEVVLPGQPPVLLRPHDPMTLEPGSKIVLSGICEISFEVTS